MAVNENYSDIASGNGHGSLSVLHPIHEAAMRIADLGLNRSKTKTRDLVALLLSHGARAWRSISRKQTSTFMSRAVRVALRSISGFAENQT